MPLSPPTGADRRIASFLRAGVIGAVIGLLIGLLCVSLLGRTTTVIQTVTCKATVFSAADHVSFKGCLDSRSAKLLIDAIEANPAVPLLLMDKDSSIQAALDVAQVIQRRSTRLIACPSPSPLPPSSAAPARSDPPRCR